MKKSLLSLCLAVFAACFVPSFAVASVIPNSDSIVVEVPAAAATTVCHALPSGLALPEGRTCSPGDRLVASYIAPSPRVAALSKVGHFDTDDPKTELHKSP